MSPFIALMSHFQELQWDIYVNRYKPYLRTHSKNENDFELKWDTGTQGAFLAEHYWALVCPNWHMQAHRLTKLLVKGWFQICINLLNLLEFLKTCPEFLSFQIVGAFLRGWVHVREVKKKIIYRLSLQKSCPSSLTILSTNEVTK